MSSNTKIALLLMLYLPLYANPNMAVATETLSGFLLNKLPVVAGAFFMVAGVIMFAFTLKGSVLAVNTLAGFLMMSIPSVSNLVTPQGMLLPKQPGPSAKAPVLTSFQKLVKQQEDLKETAKRLSENIKRVRDNLASNKTLLKEKIASLKHIKPGAKGIEERTYELKKENVGRLHEANKKLEKELLINLSKEKELADRIAYAEEYIQEVKDAKAINATLPDGVLEVNIKYLSYERLYEEIEKELAADGEKKAIKAELNEESGRVNGSDKLHRY